MKKTFEHNNKLLKILLRENIYFIIGLIIITPIYYYLKKGEQFVLDFLFVKIMSVIFLIYNIPNFIIYFNYYKENKNTQIKIDTKNNSIGIIKNGVSKQYEITEIKSSIYHLGIYYKNRIDNAMRWKMINSDLAYWDLEFNNGDRYYISNLIVDFLHDEPIVENTKYRFRMFQYINKSDSKEALTLKQELERKKEKSQTEKFVEKFESKSENELNEILTNKSKYQKEAVKAAEIILTNKNVG
ncbi:hypothetical protein [Robertkochia solimangrovi]|uniref:hypothetical protein n=1 Tax=Robertkochia solimangrovi TaxID=2213046 RepID=UPI001180E2EC|nr:hypothetical protein [Robertkochia solimangrovi]